MGFGASTPTTRGSSSSVAPLGWGGNPTPSPLPYSQPAGNGSGATPYGVQQMSVGPTQGAPGWSSGSGSSGASQALQSSVNSLISNLGGGGRSSTSPVTYNPGILSVQAQENPQLAALIGQFGQARGQISANTDQDATLALQRQRDLTSGLASEFGAEAASRGILNSGAAQQDLMKRVVNPGQAQMGQLNANLASDARNKQLSALQGEAGMVGQQAQLTQNQQQFGLQSWQAQQQAQQAQAQLAALQQNQGISNLSSIVGLIGSLGNLYSGF